MHTLCKLLFQIENFCKNRLFCFRFCEEKTHLGRFYNFSKRITVLWGDSLPRFARLRNDDFCMWKEGERRIFAKQKSFSPFSHPHCSVIPSEARNLLVPPLFHPTLSSDRNNESPPQSFVSTSSFRPKGGISLFYHLV